MAHKCLILAKKVAKKGIINTVKSFFLGDSNVGEQDRLYPINHYEYRGGFYWGDSYSQHYSLRSLIKNGYDNNAIGRGIINNIANSSKEIVFEPYWNGKPWKAKKFTFNITEALMQLLLTGTVVLRKSGSILEPRYEILNTLDITEDRVGGRYRYRYQIDGYYFEIPAEELFFIKEKNYSATCPTNMGISRLFACKDAIDGYCKTYGYNLNYLNNHGSNVLISNNSQHPIISDKVYTGNESIESKGDVFDRLVNEKVGGNKKAGKLSTTTQNISVHKLGDAPKDVLIFEGLKSYAKEIATAYNYPSILANDPDSKTYANYEQAQIGLYTECVIPFVKTITTELEKLFGYEIYINTSNISVLQVSQEKKNEKAQKLQSAIIELNEKVKYGVITRDIAVLILVTEWGYDKMEAMGMIAESGSLISAEANQNTTLISNLGE